MKKQEKIKTKERAPVVVVLGHVDHGKSSLLEAIKDLKIVEKEAGGITQHIGAYAVEHSSKKVTFIDTPGHEAFFAMRSRGTRAADIGILVVAADEGIKEQTKEAINHLKEAKMPFVVAINKIDKKDIDVERVKQELAKEDVFVESYGGNIPVVNISAKKKTGIDELLEIILLLAEIEEIKEECVDCAEGMVIETQRDSKRGVVATLLVKKGTLKKGDVVATKSCMGKVRFMEDCIKKEVEEAEPSTPVQVIGLKGCPDVGDDFFVFKKTEEAKSFISSSNEKSDYIPIIEGKKTLCVVLKADVAGSLEAIKSSLEKIPQSEINIRVVREGIGDVTDKDVECVRTSKAKIFGFKVKTDKAAERVAIRDGIEIKNFDIIYELIDCVRDCAEEMLGEEIERKELGKIKVLAVFKTQKSRQILGGKIVEGEVMKGSMVEIQRDKEVVGEGKLINIKKEEKDMEKIKEGEEFGMLLESKENAQEKDILVIYRDEIKKKKLV